jgi:hypothetical protein
MQQSLFRPTSLAFALLGLGLATPSCGLVHPPRPIPVHAWFADDLDLAPVRRVIVLPFVEANGVDAKVEEIRSEFFRELTKVQRFELLPLPTGANEDRLLLDAATRGRLSVEALVELGRRYNVDGVLFGTITAYRPYQPPHLGLRVQLVSLHTGGIVWEADAVYDSVDERVQEDLRHYVKSQLAPEQSMHDWQINMLSPRRYSAYVANRLVRSWRGV